MVTDPVCIQERWIPAYDALYAISDLHLGGEKGFQIFDSGAELAWLIRRLQASDPKKSVALVINGDFVDFLAEKDADYFDASGAVGKLDRIMEDTAFKPVWEALQAFVDTAKRHLVINLGNHDLELSLPWVRTHLLNRLAPNDAARGRILLSLDGIGFLCRVGQQRVLCVHGNEVDTWNVVDYEKLRQIGANGLRACPNDEWVPNAGTKLVIEAMNEVKKRFPFVDLLKPEVPAVLPTLLAVAPEYSNKVGTLVAVAGRLGTTWVRRKMGLLSAEEDAPAGFPAVPRRKDTSGAEQLLRQAERQLRAGVDPMSLLDPGQEGEQLGRAMALWRFARRETSSEVLREALEGLKKDRSFVLDDPDTCYAGLDEEIGAAADYIVAGHTHLERSLARSKHAGWYFNSGTWARLIKLDEELLSKESRFAALYNALSAGTMKALDDMPGLVLRHRTVVVIRVDGGRTRGELQRVESTGPDGELRLSVVDGSEAKWG